MSCLDNIVTVRNNCVSDNPESLSGFDLMDAPELTPLNLADIANEKYISGYEMAKNVLANAVKLFRNDFIGTLAANKISVNLSNAVHTTSDFNTSITFPAENKERGITLFKAAARRGSLTKHTIKTVSVYPLVSVESTDILIYDDGMLYRYTTELTANAVNTIQVNHVMKGSSVHVLLDGSEIPVASAKIKCFTGCGGKQPNDCAHAKGFNGDGNISAKESFGISVDFYCECDYEQILCDMAKGYVGNLIYLKARIGLLNERIYTNRNNNWIAYGEEEAKELKSELEQEYNQTWNTFGSSLTNSLKSYRDSCIDCKGVRWVTNV